MKDYLKELCDSLNIKLIYSDDDYIALSVGINSATPFVKANSIFKECPERVAKAIIGYYTEPLSGNDFLKILNSYLNDNVVTVEYTIGPPDETFKGVFKHIENKEPAEEPIVKKPRTRGRTSKASKPKNSTSTQKSSDEDPSYVELDISSITKKNFYGGISSIKPDETIKALNDDIIELDIQVDDPKI